MTRKNLEIVIEILRSLMQAKRKNLQDILDVFTGFSFQSYRIQNDYLASTCIRGNGHIPPQRIKQWPDEHVDQIDL